MCGIAGLLELGGASPEDPPSGKILRRMLDALRHRGPDDRGEQRLELSPAGPIFYLGHQRLSVIDVSPGGHQPMPNDDRTLWISTNSEIYNFRELRNELQSQFEFKSQSDTEVLLKAYEAWGIECLDRLTGMFAFAVWDSRAGRLILARDRLGIKPLYYFRNREYLVFASEARAILASGLVTRQIDSSGLFQYLAFGRLQAPNNLIQSIRELKPGHYMDLDLRDPEIREQRYWSPLKRLSGTEGGSLLPAVDRVRETLREAVKSRLVSDVPVGLFLSGGIDSSAIAAIVRHVSPDFPLRTLTVAFEERALDESEYAQLMARQLGTEHHVLKISEDDLLLDLPKAIGCMDQPTLDGINTWFISRCARHLDLKVALSGLGADELFGGYESFHVVPRLVAGEKYLAVLPGVLKTALGQLIGKYFAQGDKKTKLDHFLSGKWNGAHPYFLVRALFCEDQIRALSTQTDGLEADFEANRALTRDLLEPVRDREVMDQVSFLELNHYLSNVLLRDTDGMSMAHGLEVRVPFLDHRLVELMFSLPASQKSPVGSGIRKPLLVRMLDKALPDPVVRRKKMGFTLPFDTWMRGPLKEEMENILLSPVALLSPFLSPGGIQGIWEGFLKGQVSWSRPWALYVLKRWVESNG